jgi:hypothetical protein
MQKGVAVVAIYYSYTFHSIPDPYQPHNEILQQQLIDHFKGQEVTPKEIEKYVLEEPLYYHYKKNALAPLEQAARIRVNLLTNVGVRHSKMIGRGLHFYDECGV